MARIPLHCVLFLILAQSFQVCASLGIKRDGHLDMPVLRKAYMESEFESVRNSLEGFLKKHPKDATREEKIFTHMYLGVICAADTNSEYKAESHFNAVLRLSPHIEPVDMFVPPKIQNMFDRIKQDFQRREEYVQKYDAFGNPLAPSGPDTGMGIPKGSGLSEPGTGKGRAAVSEPGTHSWIWWTLGSAAIVAGGVGIYVAVASEDAPDPKTISADGTLK